MNKHIKIAGLFLGESKILSNRQESAIHKKSVNQIICQKNLILNDLVVDQKHHGGEMRAIHHYTEINYSALKQKFPELANRFIPGSFGENLYTKELTENDLCIGDIFSIGNCEIQLTVPRRPCATLNIGYNDSRILKEIISTGHVGWFYRVLIEGTIKLNDDMILKERKYPHLKIHSLFEQGYGKNKFQNKEFLKACLNTGLMDKGWEPKLKKV